MFESQPTSIQAVWLTGGGGRQDRSTRHDSPAAPPIQAFGGFLKRLSRWSGKAQDTAPARCCPAQPCC